MKVGLVPLVYEENNYGGVLQFLALQNAIKHLGIECAIIKVTDETVLCKSVSSIWWKRLAWKVLTPYFQLKSRKESKNIKEKLHERFEKCERYRRENYVETIRLEDVDINSFDAVICGSDQIWNPSRARKRAFLDFVPDNITKIVYAASLGAESMTCEQKKCFKPAIERLDYVSVREQSAKKILDEFIEGKDISVQVDPTLLLSEKDWSSFADSALVDNLNGKKYIFTYFLGGYSERIKPICRFAKDQNYIIVNIPYASGETEDKENFGDVQYISATPGDFLGLIRSAEYILTDSFHACVFSIIFKKQFYAYQRDGKLQMMNRIVTLLNHFQIKNRIIDDLFDFKDCERIDFTEKDQTHKQLRDNSLDFLCGALKIQRIDGEESI